MCLFLHWDVDSLGVEFFETQFIFKKLFNFPHHLVQGQSFLAKHQDECGNSRQNVRDCL
jgi:hypothetical protein